MMPVMLEGEGISILLCEKLQFSRIRTFSELSRKFELLEKKLLNKLFT
jgi:hypothetical protein